MLGVDPRHYAPLHAEENLSNLKTWQYPLFRTWWT